jgi:hypothetical protein
MAVQRNTKAKDIMDDLLSGKTPSVIAKNDTNNKNDVGSKPEKKIKSKQNNSAKTRFGKDNAVLFGAEDENFKALALARVLRGKTNSEIINEALKVFLKEETAIINKRGK